MENIDVVNHPSHYTKNSITVKYEPYAFLRYLNFTLGSACKYLIRYNDKGNPVEDLYKAAWYLEEEKTDMQDSLIISSNDYIVPINVPEEIFYPFINKFKFLGILFEKKQGYSINSIMNCLDKVYEKIEELEPEKEETTKEPEEKLETFNSVLKELKDYIYHNYYQWKALFTQFITAQEYKDCLEDNAVDTIKEIMTEAEKDMCIFHENIKALTEENVNNINPKELGVSIARILATLKLTTETGIACLNEHDKEGTYVYKSMKSFQKSFNRDYVLALLRKLDTLV